MEILTQLQYAIIGTLIKEPDKVADALTRLSVADFPSVAARGIFSAIGDLHFSGAPIDAITVLDKAGEEYGEAILEAQRQHTTDLDYYIDQLKERNRLAEVKKAAEGIAVAESLAAAEPLIDALNLSMVDIGRKKSLTPMEAAMRMMQRLSEPVPGFLRWGLTSFDGALRVRPGNFVAIGGYAGSGKTLLGLQFAALWAHKHSVGYFTLEMGPEEIEERLIAHLAQVPLSAVMDHRFTDEQGDAVSVALDRRSRLNLQIHSAAGWTVREIQAMTLARRHDIIFVDYLQLIRGKGSTRYEIVTNISQDIATMARRHGIIVVALSQLQRLTNGQARPTMSSFRESGQIEQDVDVALLVYPEAPEIPDPGKSYRRVDCAKNRSGRTYCTILEFSGETMTMLQSKKRPSGVKKKQSRASTPSAPIPDWVRECEQAEIPDM